MKFKISLLTICLLVITYITKAQCNPFYSLEEGKSWEISSYNGKGKFQGKRQHEIISVREVRDGIEATIALETFDKKGKSDFEKEMNIECIEGAIKVDMTGYFPPKMMDAFYASGQVVNTKNLEIPSSLTVGQELEDGAMSFNIKGTATMSTEVIDRKVVAKEKVEVPAGSFECYKITYKMKINTVMVIEMSGTEWITEGVGVVKSEFYDENGDLKGYMELSNYNK